MCELSGNRKGESQRRLSHELGQPWGECSDFAHQLMIKMTKPKADPDEGDGQPPPKKPKPTPLKCRVRRCAVYIAAEYIGLCNKRAAVSLPLPSGKPADAYCLDCWKAREMHLAFGHWRHRVF